MTNETRHPSALTENFARITRRIDDVRKNEERVDLLRGLCLTFGAAVALFILVSVIEAIAHFGTTGRTILFSAACLGLAAIFVRVALPAVLRSIGARPRATNDSVALHVGEHFPEIKDRLLNAMQVFRETHDGTSLVSVALADASFKDVADHVQTLDFTSIVETAPMKRAARTALYAFLFAAVLFAMFPSTLFHAAYRAIAFRTNFVPPAPFLFEVFPGNKEVVKGETIPLTIKLRGAREAALSLYLRDDDQAEFDHLVLTPDSMGYFHHTVENIRSSLHYYASVGEWPSQEFLLRVVDRPFLKNLRTQVIPPAYTNLPPRYQDDNVGDVTALAGTRLEFELMLNKELASAALVFDDSGATERVPLELSGMVATGRIRMMKSRAYHFELTDAAGIRNTDPIRYSLTVVADQSPSIEIVEPGHSIDLAEDMRISMLMKIADDYGFSQMRLGYKLTASKFEKPQENFTVISIPLPMNSGTNVEVPYIWNLTSLSLVPEDVVSYYVEVLDNDVVTGPKSARTDIYTVRLPSMDEVFAKAEKTQENAIDELKKSLNDVEKLQKEMEDVQREMKKNSMSQVDWQQKKKLEDMLKRQEQVAQKMEDVASKLNQMSRDMQQQNAISPETMEKYQELQKLMQEIDAPELQAAMKRMQEAMKNISPEQLKQALENFQFSEEMFKQSIERTLELLKRLQIEQKLDELTKRAEELANKQDELRERTENANPSDKEQMDRLAKEQQELKKDAEALQREMAELQKKMQEFASEMPMQEMQDAMSEMNLSQMQQQMNEAASMCEGGNSKNASQQQKKLTEQMKKVQKKMEQVKKKMNENRERQELNAYRKILQDALEISKQQEALKNELSKLPPNSQQFRDAQELQQQLAEELNKVANELMKLSRKSFTVSPEMGKHIGQAMQHMQQAMREMKERQGQEASKEQNGAMAELNEAAKKIAQGMQQSSASSQGGASLMQQLQKMASQQMGINQGTQMLGQGQMSEQQRAQLNRLIGQQAALQKTLEQIEEEAKRSQDGNRILGDLRRIGEDMQEVVRDMQQQNVNPETIQRQEKILSRLLDASRSTRERDYEKKRRSETGKDVVRRSPTEIDPNALDEKKGIQRDMQRAIQEGYNKDYEELIRKYFDALQKLNVAGSQ